MHFTQYILIGGAHRLGTTLKLQKRFHFLGLRVCFGVARSMSVLEGKGGDKSKVGLETGF